MKLSPPHPLYGAQLRSQRARQLIGTLRRQCQRWAEAQAEPSNLVVREVEPMVFHADQANPPVQHLFRAAITVGEIAYNCRAALDYLVWALAKGSNGNVEVRGTQFPIEDNEEWFWARWTGKHPTEPGKRVARYLHKVPKKAAEIFSDMQPYNDGCEWAALLRDISNPDKHRTVAAIASDVDVRNASFEPLTGRVRGTLAVRVVFEHDRELDVITGLDRIQREVANILTGFAPAFQPL